MAENDQNNENEGQGLDPNYYQPISPQSPNIPRPSIPAQISSQLGSLPHAVNDPILSALNQIRYLNDRVRMNTEDMSNYLQKHLDELKSVTSAGQQDKIRNDQQKRITPPTQIPETKYQKLHQQATQMYSDVVSASAADQLEQLKNLGRVDKEGRVTLGRHTKLSTEDFTKVSEAVSGQGDLNELAPELQRVARGFKKNLAQTIVNSFGKEWETAAGFENLRGKGFAGVFLGGASKFIHAGSHAAGHAAGIPMPTGAMGASVMSGEGEVNAFQGLQDIAGRRTFAYKLGDLLESRAERGGKLGGMAGGLGRIMTEGRLPVIGEGLIAYELLKEFGSRIPIVGSLENAGNQLRNLRQTGQVTGQGVEAGFEATQIAPYNLMQGGQFRRLPVIGGLLGIFDPITKQVADEIVKSVREQGFTGDLANQMYQSVASVYRKLGIDPALATDFITSALRQGGETLQQITDEMKGFSDSARNLQVSVSDYTQAINSLAEEFRVAGSGPGAVAEAQQFVAGAPIGYRTGAGLTRYQQAIQQASPLLYAQTGILPGYDIAGGSVATQEAFQSYVTQWMARAQGLAVVKQQAAQSGQSTFQVAAEFLNQNGPPGIQGMGADLLTNLIKQYSSGGGPARVEQLTSAATSYSRAMRRAAGPRKDTTQAVRDYWLRTTGRVPSQVANRRFYDDPEDTMSMDTVEKLRKQSLSSVKNILTKQQYDDLQKHINDRSYNFAGQLTAFASQAGKKGSNAFNTPWGQIIISFKGKAAKALTATTIQNQNAVNYGVVPSNQAYPYSSTRIPPLTTPGG